MINTDISIYSINDLVETLVSCPDTKEILEYLSYLTGLSEDKLSELISEKEKSTNTKIGFLYRDACNYKTWNTVVVRGIMSEEDIDKIIDSLDCGEMFIPEQIGFDCVRSGDPEDDHCWAELCREDFSSTLDEPTVDLTAEEVVKRFCEAKGKWDDIRYAIGG